MVKPSDVVSALVEAIQDISEVVTAVGSEVKIYAYSDVFPSLDRQRAISEMPTGSIMVAYETTTEPERGAIRHQLAIYARPLSGDSAADLAYLVIAGVPDGQERNLITVGTIIHADLQEMVLNANQEQQDSEGVLYLELNVSFTENWG